MSITRRAVLGLPISLALASALGAGGSGNNRRFLFIHAEGGWDPLCVFAPLFGRASIDMEADAAPLTVGGLSLVDSPSRPTTRRFFETWGARTLLLNGVSTRSVNHETCQAVALTGSTSSTHTDIPTLLAADRADDFRLPHIAFSGPVFSGDHAVLVSRATGLIQSTVRGELGSIADVPVNGVGEPIDRVVGEYLSRRAATFAKYRSGPRSDAYLEALRRAGGLTDDRYEIDLQPSATVISQGKAAIAALRDGVCRVASLGTGFVWDSHVNNTDQTTNFESLFADLDALLDELQRTNGPEGKPLSDDTVVVLSSEMGRTPGYNGTAGRDHWPFTSVLMIGPGITGNRVVGAFDDLYGGIGVDVATGELNGEERGIPSVDVGATLLALGDVDAKAVLPSGRVITGVLA